MSIQDQYDLIVVGCGFCGSVIARLAADIGKRVLILERRNHIAGNMYDEYDENGFLIQKYGPHIFHTNEDKVVDFLRRFSKWNPYQLHYGVELDGRCIPAPFGFKAIRMMYQEKEAEDLIQRLKRSYPDRDNIPILELMESSDEKLSDFAEMLYYKNYQPYAAKQWNLDPKALDRSVVARMPIILSERENYFTDKYEILPEKGFTCFFYNMLLHDNIHIELGVDANSFLSFDFQNGICRKDKEEITVPVVYTGALEEIFGSSTPLPYRSLYFEYQTIDRSNYQPVALLTYPQTKNYIRTTEFSKLTGEGSNGKTVVSFEFSVPYNKRASRGNEPYYPILTKENVDHNNYYLQRLKHINNLIPCGRLADYKYYNMDQAIIRAFEVFHGISQRYWG